MIRIGLESLNKQFVSFRTKVLKMPLGQDITIGDFILQRNLRIMRVAALLVFLTDVFWLVTNMRASEDAKLYTGFVLVSGYIHIALSAIMTLTAYFAKEITDKNRGFVKCVFIVFYLYTIYHVAIYAINFDERALLAGANTEFIGIAVSTFYLFVIAFAPMYEWYYSGIIGVFMLLGYIMPMLVESADYYACVEQGLLRLFIVAAYIIILRINTQLCVNDIHLMELNEEFSIASYVDRLTDVLNRRAMDDWWQYMRKDANINQAGIMLYDVDNFKSYNDHYSHLKGDEVLKNVCKAVAEAIVDEPDVYFFRYGGEEFVLLFANPTELYVKQLGYKIVSAVYDMNMPRDDIEERDRVTITLGCAIVSVADITDEGVTDMDYLKYADKQTYIGKHNGKNCYVFNDEVVPLID